MTTTTYKTAAEAKGIYNLRNAHLVPGAALRHHPAIVKVEGGYKVITLGEAKRHGLKVEDYRSI